MARFCRVALLLLMSPPAVAQTNGRCVAPRTPWRSRPARGLDAGSARERLSRGKLRAVQHPECRSRGRKRRDEMSATTIRAIRACRIFAVFIVFMATVSPRADGGGLIGIVARAAHGRRSS